jgi:hypothetical protein
MFPVSKINLTKLFSPPPASAGTDPAPKNNDERLLGAMVHLLPMVGPLVPPHLWFFAILPPLVFWQIKRGQSVFLSAVGLEVLNFQICAAGVLSLGSIRPADRHRICPCHASSYDRSSRVDAHGCAGVQAGQVHPLPVDSTLG